jgi:hypothetical protein
MRILLVIMQMCGGIGGTIMILSGLWSVARMASRRNFLVKTTGTIRSIEKKVAEGSPTKNSRIPRTSFFPTISFQNASGDTVKFKSEAGHRAHVCKYHIGQSIAVVYDPEGRIPPMIDEWFARWGFRLMMILGGIMFLGGAALIEWILRQPKFAV